MVENPRRDPSSGVRAEWAKEILKTGNLESYKLTEILPSG